MADGDAYLEQIKERRNLVAGEKSMKLTFYEQVAGSDEGGPEEDGSKVTEAATASAEIPPTDSPTQITLEGISGMVVMDAKAARAENGKEEEDED